MELQCCGVLEFKDPGCGFQCLGSSQDYSDKRLPCPELASNDVQAACNTTEVFVGLLEFHPKLSIYLDPEALGHKSKSSKPPKGLGYLGF